MDAAVLGTFAVNAFAAMTLPPAQIKEATGPGGAVVHYNASATGGDDHNGRPTIGVVCSPASGSLFPLGTTSVQCQASNGEHGSFQVTVIDTTPPALDLPHDFSVQGTSAGATVTYHATAHDLVDGTTSVHCSPPSGAFFAIGTSNVHCSSRDSRDNMASGKFAVTVIAPQPPPPPPPPPHDDITAEAMGPTGAVVTYTVPGTGDDHNGRPLKNGNCSPASGSTFPLGETVVRCSAGTFKITIVDTTPPALFLPADITSQSNVVTYIASAEDLVDGSVLVNCTPPSGSTFDDGTTLVQCSASDMRGNSTQGSFNVTVEQQQDTEAPTITAMTATPMVLEPPNGKLVEVVIGVTVIDNVDDSPYVGVFNVTANESITDDDWNIIEPLRIELRASRDGQGDGRVYTVWVEAIDDAGNRSVEGVNVRVPHDSGSSVSAPTEAPKKRRRAVR
ncbi:MAG TPA: HYR domain-containing protein [Thermoanaerobaculia bacterium]|nr:HYR domain-containing protein [Thermoanaerobaculia bacterium]